MKPVAWWITYRDDDGIPQLQVLPHPVHPDSPLAKRGGVAQEPLYTADQLWQAKVEVLREAAEACPGYAKASNLREYIRRMADELEAGK